jgi:hypothetical protein
MNRTTVGFGFGRASCDRAAAALAIRPTDKISNGMAMLSELKSGFAVL